MEASLHGGPVAPVIHSSGVEPIALQPIAFQPIVNTSNRSLVGHDCVCSSDSCSLHLAIHAAARQSCDSIYFLPFSPASIDVFSAPIDAYGLQPQNIVFVIAESEFIRDPAGLGRFTEKCRSAGVQFAVSGAAGGPESLSVLRDFRPAWIRLDQSLVRNAAKPLNMTAIHQFVEAGARLRAPLIANGVDRLRTVENLWLLGVQIMQGTLFGRPAPHTLNCPEGDIGR